MITTKLVRTAVTLVVVALVAVVALEVHWSMDAKSDARRTAGHAADAAYEVMTQRHDSLAARQAAEATATGEHKQLVAFTVETGGVVRVTVNTRAKSYLLKHFGFTRSVSDVTVTASSPRTLKK